jgi:hypothetical protein
MSAPEKDQHGQNERQEVLETREKVQAFFVQSA